jgi:hypothetical protein
VRDREDDEGKQVKQVKTITYTLTKDEAAIAITDSIFTPIGYKVDRVEFKIAEVDGDSLDRYPGRNEVTEVKVHYKVSE